MNLLVQHLDTMLATLDVLKSQIEMFRATVQAAEVPVAKPAMVGRCIGVERCGLEDHEARQSKATFAHPHAWKCVGCGHEEGMNGPM